MPFSNGRVNRGWGARGGAGMLPLSSCCAARALAKLKKSALLKMGGNLSVHQFVDLMAPVTSVSRSLLLPIHSTPLMHDGQARYCAWLLQQVLVGASSTYWTPFSFILLATWHFQIHLSSVLLTTQHCGTDLWGSRLSPDACCSTKYPPGCLFPPIPGSQTSE